MPTNLNALIRYKQIDAYLQNKYVDCTIEKLQDACSVALGEFRGNYSNVSERTIRDDIRVMRSDILGFNAPIEVSNGRYYYTDSNYSIFSTPVTEVELLKDILKMLLAERDNITDSEIDKLLTRISIIVGEPIQFDSEPDNMGQVIHEAEESESDISDIRFSIGAPRDIMHSYIKGASTGRSSSKLLSSSRNINVLIIWKEILKIF